MTTGLCVKPRINPLMRFEKLAVDYLAIVTYSRSFDRSETLRSKD